MYSEFGVIILTYYCIHKDKLNALCNAIRADCLLMSPHAPMQRRNLGMLDSSRIYIQACLLIEALYVAYSTFQA